MNKTDRSIFTAVINCFGEDEQTRVAQEECAELIKALSKYHRVTKYQAYDKRKIQRCLNNIREEMVDVQIMLDQLQIIFGFTNKELEETRRSKVDRLSNFLPEEDDNAV